MCKGSIQHYAAVIDQISDPSAGQALGRPIPGVPCPIRKARTSAPPSYQVAANLSPVKAIPKATSLERVDARAGPLRTARCSSRASSAPICSPTFITCSNALNTAPSKTDADHKQRITPSCAKCFAWRGDENENFPGMRQEHDDDGLDGELPMALPWMHELRWPLGTAQKMAAPMYTDFPIYGYD